MNRREALSSVALLLGGTLLGSQAFLSGCKTNNTDLVAFTPEDIAFLNEVAETILPKTDTPGAKEAKVGEFMTVIVKDCYKPEEAKVFMAGMVALQFKDAKAKIGKAFMEASAAERHTLLVALDAEQKAFQEKKKPEELPHYFRMMKELTLWGFFTSEIGATKALRYVAVPGKYEGCIDYKKGDKAWAT
jgi:Gluconate 2-dehydrogenase subunit 3